MVWLVLFCFGMMFFMYAFSRGYRCVPRIAATVRSAAVGTELTQRLLPPRFVKWLF